jgi:hypothetical protein
MVTVIVILVIVALIMTMMMKKRKKRNLVNQGKKRGFYLMRIFLKKPKSLSQFYNIQMVTILF